MKIRKKEHSVGILGKILNLKNNSKTDTYSANYLNDRIVKVSPTEPITGEKVWIQKGKNLFDKSNVSFPCCWLATDGTIQTTVNQDAVSEYIKVTPNTIYTISGFANNQYFALHSYDENKNHSNMIYADTLTNGVNISFTTGENDYYIRIAINIFDVSNNIQIEKGSTATNYEPFIRKIYIKNDNDEYEEFYNEEEHNKQVYSTEEQVIGTWIDGKPLYRKVLTLDTPAPGATSHIYYNNPNVKEICSIQGTIYRKDRNIGIPIGSRPSSNWHTFFEDVYANYEGKMLIIITMGSLWTEANFGGLHVIVEYTKTTD